MNKNYTFCFRVVGIVLSLSIICCLFAGCGNTSVNIGKYRSVNGNLPDSFTIAQNDDYELDWNADGSAITLKSLTTDDSWCDILYDSYLDGSISSVGNSPIAITVANVKTMQWDTIYSYSLAEGNGNILTKKIDNGLRVTYFFEKYKIAVPVEYTLRDDCLNVKIDSSSILEDGDEYKIISVAVTQNICSVKNDAPGGALFVPAGCGALMYTAENADSAREYSAEVYGTDASRRNPLNLTDDQQILLPVFGAYSDNGGIMGIIESGAASCFIKANAGDKKLKYSYIGAEFYLRGYDEFSYTYHGKYKGITTRISENISGDVLSINYYPLTEGNADYNGIAEKYRNYLLDNDMLTKSEADTSPYSLTIYGGTNISKSFFGIPYSELKALTTFTDASSIINDITENVGISPVVRMYGFSDNGVRYGQIAGGKKYQSVYGCKNDLLDLINTNSNTNIYFDYEVVNFADSGYGISVKSDTAKTAISYKAEHYDVDPLRVNNKKSKYYVISRNLLSKAVDKALAKADSYGIKNVSFSSLGYTAYSDTDCISKKGIESSVKNILNSTEKAYSVAVANANSYAACCADIIFDTADNNGNWDSLDEVIPFYQMIFHSYKSMYSNGINTDENASYAVARAVAFGMGLGFTVTESYIEDSDDLGFVDLYSTVYDNNRQQIIDSLVTKNYSQIYDAVKDARLIEYKIENGISTSVFDNGSILYVNQTNKTVNYTGGELCAYEFSLN